MADSVDSDQMPQNAASDQSLHCLQRPICPNTLGYYGTSVGVSAQSDQILWCLYEETLHPWLSKMQLMKILIRLRKQAHFRLYVFWW